MSNKSTTTIGGFIRKAQNDYVNGSTTISKYVVFSQHKTIEKIEAYLNSKHITGERDNLQRKKPFMDIVTASANIWFRATDLDRNNIKIRALKQADWLRSFLATIKIREWMRKEFFGIFLNDWGRTLSRYGSAVVKFVENDSGLHMSIVPWNRLICDVVDFEGNPKIEILELTEAQLRRRIQTHGYDEDAVKGLVDAINSRENLDRQRKDNRTGYIQVFELHGELPKFHLTSEEEDKDVYVQQIHVVSFVGKGGGKKKEFEDFTLFSGEEADDPYVNTHLIKEEGRTLSIGSVEHNFQSQWQTNHSIKAIRDTLDITSKAIFQTSDGKFLGRNAIHNIIDGDILIHKVNEPLTRIANGAFDTANWSNYGDQWRRAGREINGISEAMLGVAPKSGTAWRQTQAILQESHSLFELMTENKGLQLETMFIERIIPHIKKSLDTTEEIEATLESHNIDRIDAIFIPNMAKKRFNERSKNDTLAGRAPEAFNAEFEEAEVKSDLSTLGNQRFFKASDFGDKTWKEYFDGMEWDLEYDFTGEQRDVLENLETLNTALQVIANPDFKNNKEAQMVVGRILELTGAISPVELSIARASQETQVDGSVSTPERSQLPTPKQPVV